VIVIGCNVKKRKEKRTDEDIKDSALKTPIV
jgi:hypothetical protein